MDTKLLNALLDEKAEFFVTAKPSLKTLIVEGTHPFVKDLMVQWKYMFLNNSGIRIGNEVVKKYIDRTLDEKNTFLLDHCDIRLYGGESIISQLIAKSKAPQKD